MIKKTLFLFAAAFLIQSVFAAEPAVPTPLSLPENFSCTVKVTQPGGAPTGHAPKEIDIIRFQGIRKDLTTFANGDAPEELWNFEKADLAFYETAGSQSVYSVRGEQRSLMIFTLLKFTPETLDLVKPANFQGNVDYQGVKCSHYHGLGPSMSAGIAPHPLPCDAWIDIKTGLPAAFADPDWIFTLTFNPPPTALPPMPPNIAQEWKKSQTPHKNLAH